MYALSKFGTEIWPTMQLPDGQRPLVYGDPAYFLGPGVIGGIPEFTQPRYDARRAAIQ
jgi:hypothetical protein